ncbi:tannase/feruloyl esterase family alpha/beta hydrolase [Novosphingobium pokkalii]|uniref:tannase/feruloyl esterase family alpha/beta hydrolase n=1 Tax=Novosphingobium pokkalii TaxID=1770194 RepID=UPI00363B662B
MGAHEPDLDRFRARGGRLIVPHGASDPVFSLNDTLAWWRALDRHSGGQAAGFARVFPVPGMAHCAGGPATDRYALRALADWVEKGRAPDALAAKAGPATPWPGRERPLCRYPLVARTKGGVTACALPPKVPVKAAR